MNGSYRNAVAGPSTQTSANPKPKKKKIRAEATPSPRPARVGGPIPQPYLALAPSPVSSLSRSTLDELALPPKLVLPSTYPYGRGSKSTPNVNLISSRGYAAGLLAPPSIRPGGTPLPPRVQGEPSPASAPRRRASPRVGVGTDARRRSEERLGDVRDANASMASLGLGQIIEDTPPEGDRTTPNEAPAGNRRRRRIVRGETGLNRRLTVSSREEGRAMGLARGASMRRVNVWDDVPESSEPPPPFPFPTASSARLPPSIDAASPASPTSPSRTAGRNPTMDTIPNSPPPTYETLPTVREDPENQEAPGSPATTHYASALASPVASVVSLSEEDTAQEEREDRKLWNADLTAGYSLEERVKRERGRKEARDRAAEEAQREGERRVEVEQAQAVAPEPTKKKGKRKAQSDVAPPPPEPVEVGTSRFIEEERAEHFDSTSAPKPKAKKKKKKTMGIVQRVEEPIGLGLSTNEPQVPVPPAVIVEEPSTPVPPVSTESAATEVPAAAIPDPPKATQTLPPVSIPITDLSPVASPPIESIPEEAPAQPTEATEDIVIQQSSPERKLTRGKAIRRSSSGITIAEGIQSRRASRRISASLSPKDPEAPEPLFSTGGYTFTPSPSAVPMGLPHDALEVPQGMPPQPHQLAYRASAPSLNTMQEQRQLRSSVDEPKETSAKWGALDRGYKLSDPSLTPFPDAASPSLPPHREAALKRRELSLRRSPDAAAPPKPTTPAPLAISPASAPVPTGAPASGPLIDFDTPVSTTHDLSHLLLNSHELLSLLEQEAVSADREAAFVTPAAESSTQAAARAAALHAPSVVTTTPTVVPADHSREDPPTIPSHPTEEHATPKKKVPPPPPASRPRGASGLAPRKSIIASANSPVTPRPIHRPPPPPGSSVPQDHLPESPLSRAPSMPTRRPPPPPPKPPGLVTLPADAPNPASGVPSWASRPTHLRNDSLVSSETASSSDSIPPLPPWTPLNTRRSSVLSRVGTKPRGPRPLPPPVPPRPWLKARPALRPIGERTRSDDVLSPSAHVEEESRPNSMAELRSVESGNEPRSPVEYTDLDVLVSRLEGSGREYEVSPQQRNVDSQGFTQISNFLGPAKSPAATPEALATLLPAPIFVDSRRTTAQGKVKLKLSLLGVRVSKCPICLAQFKEAETAVLLPHCGHTAHEECARKWFREDDRCFVCRVPLLKVDDGVDGH